MSFADNVQRRAEDVLAAFSGGKNDAKGKAAGKKSKKSEAEDDSLYVDDVEVRLMLRAGVLILFCLSLHFACALLALHSATHNTPPPPPFPPRHHCCSGTLTTRITPRSLRR
jgi:hypothetical protein